MVTGASKNIGAAIAASFASAGADVLLVARGAQQLTATAELIRRQAPERRIETVVADVSVPDEIARLVDHATGQRRPRRHARQQRLQRWIG
jgi:short-subunit dehydrogenase